VLPAGRGPPAVPLGPEHLPGAAAGTAGVAAAARRRDRDERGSGERRDVSPPVLHTTAPADARRALSKIPIDSCGGDGYPGASSWLIAGRGRAPEDPGEPWKMPPIRRWAGLMLLAGVVSLLSGCCCWCDRPCGRYGYGSGYGCTPCNPCPPQRCCPP